jgi:hypothetical protein
MRRLSFKTSTKMATKKGGVINVGVHLLSPRASKEVVHRFKPRKPLGRVWLLRNRVFNSNGDHGLKDGAVSAHQLLPSADKNHVNTSEPQETSGRFGVACTLTFRTSTTMATRNWRMINVPRKLKLQKKMREGILSHTVVATSSNDWFTCTRGGENLAMRAGSGLRWVKVRKA